MLPLPGTPDPVDQPDAFADDVVAVTDADDLVTVTDSDDLVGDADTDQDHGQADADDVVGDPEPQRRWSAGRRSEPLAGALAAEPRRTARTAQ